MPQYDAIVVGAGPNGLAAAITLARHGCSVLVREAKSTCGGGMRTAQCTLPGFHHDLCSAIHPLGVASPFFRTMPWQEYGVRWIHPELPLAHPVALDRAAAVYRSLEETAAGFGVDQAAYRRLLEPFVRQSDALLKEVLGPLHLPRHPLLMARFGIRGIASARSFVDRWFRTEEARGMFAGLAAHSILPLEQRLTAAVGLMFAVTAHGRGWPFPRGGSQQLANAMQRYLEDLGGRVQVDAPVERLDELPSARAILFDGSPRNLVRIAGDLLPAGYRRRLERFRHGPGSFKVDWALSGPIPWRAEACRRAGTVHVGGTFDEVALAERANWQGRPADNPFVLVAQQSLFDDSRAPRGQHTGWGYCHVPASCTVDMTDRIEDQIERFAPGFKDLILDRHKMFPQDLERYNANYIGGDITGGVMDAWQLFTRPVARWNPYTTPVPHLFLCSASTPPGGGVHGMCGWHAARAVLRRRLR
ncbi:phytoene desaturase family protein [Roseimaritima sediminicola]|uniref:phytoene desaturase family protein n=1 Tax=Roseimaritima sediminicola TaxID=2662066 RepID=UPI0012982F82|nr:NAD(P)/FAD-dependent oxidoreductase [Roseimaritima sediminicola]